MEDIISNNQEIPIKKALTAAQRKAKQRQKDKAIKEGSYNIPLIDQAKQDLLKIKDYSLAVLLQEKKYDGKFNEEQLKQLKYFVNNHKQKIKKELETLFAKEQQEINIKEKAKRLGNQQIPQLHQALLNPQTYQERIELIKMKIQENLYLFLEYMENYQPQSQDFMKIIIDLYNEFDEDTSTKLFARVCFRHRGEILLINAFMVQKAMNFLLEKKVDNIAAFGLLRLVYQNNISFYDFPIQLLIDFQTQYEQTILNFFKSISPLKFQVVESLPPTCFCFTSPIIKALKDGGDILHTQVPYQFLPYIIEILCYSFSNEEKQFENFLHIFKNGCKKLYEILLTSDFFNLLQALSDKIKTMNNIYFKKLSHSTLILEKAFFLLQEKKICQFNEETLQLLLESNQEQFQMLNQRPKIIKKGSKSLIQQILHQCQQKNNVEQLQNIFLEDTIPIEQLHIFQSMGISNLLPIQEICFRYCEQIVKNGKYFIQYDIGQGKTSLCLAIATLIAKQGYQVYIVNVSHDLAFRDFKKAFKIKEKLQLDILWLNDKNINIHSQNSIIFCSLQNYLYAYKNLIVNKQKDHLCIFDEFDSCIFVENPYLQDSFNILQSHPFLIGFSGSEFQMFQKSFLQQEFNGLFIDFSLNHTEKLKTQCLFVNVYTTKKQFQTRIIETCNQQVNKTPVIIILKDGFYSFKTQLQSKGIVVENLAEADVDIIESSMDLFKEKQKEKYQNYIINESQGRGFDFQSNSEIEKNGGIFLIIACLPSCYLQFNQFIGRTGRIGNNGQYSVILFDKQAQNCDGQTYLNKNFCNFRIKIFYSFRTLDNKITKKNAITPNKQNTLQIFNEVQEVEREVMEQQEFHKIQQHIQQQESIQQDIKINSIEEEIKSFENIDDQNLNIKEVSCKKRNNKANEKNILRQSKRIQNQNDSCYIIDKSYFENYSDPKVQEKMLNDNIRINGLVIVDIGAGTGILSMMAAKSEQSDIIQTAIETIKQNGLQQIISCIKSKAEDVILPVQKVDVIISEWMGYSLLYENMLPSVLNIRDKYLKEDGQIVPNRAQLFIAGVFKQLKQNGFDFNLVNKKFVQEEQIMTHSYPVIDLSLDICQNTQKFQNIHFELKALKDGQISGFILWLQVFLTDTVILTTEPGNQRLIGSILFLCFNKTLKYKKMILQSVHLPYNSKKIITEPQTSKFLIKNQIKNRKKKFTSHWIDRSQKINEQNEIITPLQINSQNLIILHIYVFLMI